VRCSISAELWTNKLKSLVQLFMAEGILFVVVEKKFDYEGNDNIAQLFLDLLCKSKFQFLS
jgi:hypothetical protein